MHLRSVLASACVGMMAACPVRATSIFVEGVIVDVSANGSAYTLKGYDHYNHTRYGDKITNIPVKVAANPVFVLDNRMVRREIALAQGRWAYAIGSSAGAGITVVLSEPATRVHGRVVSADGARLKLKIVQGLDSREEEMALDPKALFRAGGKEAAREAVLAEGNAVRVAPARKQTVLAFAPASVITELPAGFSGAAWGVLKEPAGPKLSVLKGGEIEEYTPESRKLTPVFDIVGDVCHGSAPKSALLAGQSAVVLGWQKRGPGKVDWYLVTQWPDDGRTDGVIKSFGGGKLVLDELVADGVRETTVTVDDGAATQLDNRDAPAADALKPGHYASVYAARPQWIETVQWPEHGGK